MRHVGCYFSTRHFNRLVGVMMEQQVVSKEDYVEYVAYFTLEEEDEIIDTVDFIGWDTVVESLKATGCQGFDAVDAYVFAHPQPLLKDYEKAVIKKLLEKSSIEDIKNMIDKL